MWQETSTMKTFLLGLEGNNDHFVSCSSLCARGWALWCNYWLVDQEVTEVKTARGLGTLKKEGWGSWSRLSQQQQHTQLPLPPCSLPGTPGPLHSYPPFPLRLALNTVLLPLMTSASPKEDVAVLILQSGVKQLKKRCLSYRACHRLKEWHLLAVPDHCCIWLPSSMTRAAFPEETAKLSWIWEVLATGINPQGFIHPLVSPCLALCMCKLWGVKGWTWT